MSLRRHGKVFFLTAIVIALNGGCIDLVTDGVKDGVSDAISGVVANVIAAMLPMSEDL